jgi:hypothetical protein
MVGGLRLRCTRLKDAVQLRYAASFCRAVSLIIAAPFFGDHDRRRVGVVEVSARITEAGKE